MLFYRKITIYIKKEEVSPLAATKLMISVVDAAEAAQAAAGGAQLLDVKNPAEGALGAPLPEALWAVRGALAGGGGAKLPLSIALGDYTGRVGAAALAALGACAFSPQYVKLAFGADCPAAEAENCLSALARTLGRGGGERPPALVACLYADTLADKGFSLKEFTQLCARAGARGCLLDTQQKDGRTLLDALSPEALAAFAEDCRKEGLLCALAGSLKAEQLSRVAALGPDIIGLRGAACEGGDRLSGRVSAGRVAALRALLEESNSPSPARVPGRGPRPLAATP